MARASHKIDLINDSLAGYENLLKLVNSFTDDQQKLPFLFEDRDKNIRDVLVHLHEWHNMMILWHKEGTIEGNIPDVPRKGYSWATLKEMNIKIWEEYQNVSLEESKTLLNKTHSEVLQLIESHSNEDLFLRNQYKWTNDTVLGSYFVSAMPSHYEWAITKIKKQQKLLKKK